MKKTSFSPLNDFWLSFIDVSIYNLVLVQDFNPIKVPRHREDLEKFSVQTSICEEVCSIIRIYNC